MEHHERYMNLALDQARAALALGEFPVGCILVMNGKVVAEGRRTSSRDADANELDHGEIVALRSLLTKAPATDCSKITAYSTMEPCLMCFATLLLNGIRHFVYAYEDAMGGGTCLDLAALPPLYQEMKVEITPHVLRAESLALFQTFFSNPANQYWQDSYLARYTLKQP